MPGLGPDADGFPFQSGAVRNVPADLEALAQEAGEDTCHVCGGAAAAIVEKTDELGSAVVFCTQDFRHAFAGDVSIISRRLSINYGEPEAEVESTAKWLTTDLGRHVTIKQ